MLSSNSDYFCESLFSRDNVCQFGTRVFVFHVRFHWFKLEREVNKMQEHYQKSVQNAMTQLDKEFLRKMQAAYFRCGMKCCDDQSSTVSEVQRCIEHCEAPLSQAHSFMQNELAAFQNRLQQCSTECSNRARDNLKSDPTDEDIKKAQRQAFDCSKTCLDSHLSKGLPALVERLQSQLRKLKTDQLKLVQ
ncbi:hypothetical protein FGIG_06259 [Fasciola gigantica]|uniref:Protein FAM136A n=1 Tax=Fasciola gigantica TaxID=46835 RepID=A0A504YW91_FASGI|nr:hypothetical protein FGIG_06259 [Fasciola gigantica]